MAAIRAFTGHLVVKIRTRDHPMFQRATRAPMLTVNTAAIEQRLRALEQRLERMGRDAGRQAGASLSQAGDQIGDALASALNEIVDQLRGRARSAGDEAAKLGNVALHRVSDRVQAYPFAALAIAVGVGLLIGLAG